MKTHFSVYQKYMISFKQSYMDVQRQFPSTLLALLVLVALFRRPTITIEAQAGQKGPQGNEGSTGPSGPPPTL
jgi:hypothetical protein